MKNNQEGEWFESWFDTQWYHTLYQHRDYTEAEAFVKMLTEKLPLEPKGARILDLACGKGRHSITLASLGYDTTGVDLSENSIVEAKKSENEHLNFAVHDMRRPVGIGYFDYVLNLFTSFGYFATKREDELVLKSAFQSLKSGGGLVIDYFNSQSTLASLVEKESKTIDGITFNISRGLVNGQIEKNIAFEANGRIYHFVEKVRAYSKSDLETMLIKVGFVVEKVFGSYQLTEFNPEKSPRLIISAIKK